MHEVDDIMLMTDEKEKIMNKKVAKKNYVFYAKRVLGEVLRLDEYSCAAEPPVQYRLSHLSRRSEPLINHTICYDASLLA